MGWLAAYERMLARGDCCPACGDHPCVCPEEEVWARDVEDTEES